MRPQTLLALLPVSLLTLAAATGAQQAVAIDRPALRLDDIPILPALALDSPRDTLLFADRFPVTPGPGDMPAMAAGTPTLVDVVIPSETTGTGFNEVMQYQLPADYDPFGAPLPLVVAYHGFGASANSVQLQSTIDEFCNSFGWVYMAPTGIDDKLFGSPISQQNVDAAIQHMLDNFNVDPDRIYMVGFSMGGGVVGNYASRHRDPDGIMIAAVATVSGSLDWTMAWNEDPGAQPWLENPFNFGAPPATDPFAYQASSTLHHLTTSYPPLPASIDVTRSMARNLADVPVWVTWDTADTLTYLPHQSSNLVDWLDAQFGDVTSVPVSGTVDPGTGNPATHSWAVLDEAALFAWFDGKTADRAPESLRARFEQDRPATWLSMVQRTPGAFSDADGLLDLLGDEAEVRNVRNADRVIVDVGDAGLPLPAGLSGIAADSDGFTLFAEGGVGYLTDDATGLLVAGQEYSPDGAGAPVGGMSTVHVTARAVTWDGSLVLDPDPAAPGGTVEVAIDGPSGTGMAWLVAGVTDAVSVLGGEHILLVGMEAATLFIPLPLDGDGDLTVTASLPSDPSISGARLVLQAAFVTGSGLDGLSNAFAFDVE